MASSLFCAVVAVVPVDWLVTAVPPLSALELTSNGTVETTFSTTGSGDQMVAIVATFKEAGAAGPDLQQLHYRWRNDDGGESTGGLDTGSGADGSVIISTSQNINTAVLGSNRSTNADGILTAVTANPTGTSITVTSTTGIAAGDEILLINLQGASGDVLDVGNYELLTVDTVPNGTTLH